MNYQNVFRDKNIQVITDDVEILDLIADSEGITRNSLLNALKLGQTFITMVDIVSKENNNERLPAVLINCSDEKDPGLAVFVALNGQSETLRTVLESVIRDMGIPVTADTVLQQYNKKLKLKPAEDTVGLEKLVCDMEPGETGVITHWVNHPELHGVILEMIINGYLLTDNVGTTYIPEVKLSHHCRVRIIKDIE